MSLALDQELAFLSLVLKYEEKCLELAYESPITGALKQELTFISLLLKYEKKILRVSL